MSTNKRKIVIIGATSTIAEQCARLWIKELPSNFVLIGRDLAKTKLIAADLKVRDPESTIESIEADFLEPNKISSLINDIARAGDIDIALIAHGSLPNQQQCQDNLDTCLDALSINGISPVLFAEAIAAQMQKANKGTLAIIGSVAGDRGRKSNYVYGAAKGLVTRYAQGLQHRLASTCVSVVLIKPGPTDTPMTAHLKQQDAKLASVESVALSIVDGIRKGKSQIYAPAKWALVMMVIRHLPLFIFNRMDI